MKKLLTYSGAIIAFLVLIVIGVVAYITVFFNPNDLKPRIINTVKQRTGIELSLKGPLSWTVFPSVGLKARNVVVRVPNRAIHAPDLAHVAEMDVSVQVLPLLGRHVIIKGVELNRPQFELYKDLQGHTNWQVVDPGHNLDHTQNAISKSTPTPTSKTTSTPQVSPDSTKAHSSIVSIAHGNSTPILISHLRITEGAIHYVDNSSKQKGQPAPLSVELHNVNLNASDISSAHTFPVKLAFDAFAPSFQKGHIALDAEVTPDLSIKRYTFSHIRLKGRGVIPKLNKSEEQQFSLSVPTLIADMGHHGYQANDAHMDLVLYPTMKGNAVPVSVNSSLAADMAKQVLEFTHLTIHGHDQLNMQGHVAVSQLMTNAHSSGEVNLQGNLHEWLQSMDVDTAGIPAEALSRVQAGVQWEGDRSSLNVANINGHIDSTPFNGEAALNFAASDYSFKLNTGALDLDRYLAHSRIHDGTDDKQDVAHSSPEHSDLREHAEAGTPSTQAPTASISEAHQKSEVSGPFSFLQQRRIHGIVTMDALTLHRMQLNHLMLNVNSDDGLVQPVHLTASGYGGHFDIIGSVNTRHMPLSLTLQPKVSSLALGKFLADVSPKTGKWLDGILSASGVFSTEGNDSTDFQRNLSGRGQIDVTDGRVNGVDIPGQVCRATTFIRKHTLTNNLQSSTPIRQLNGTFVIQQGIVNVNGINASLPGFNVNGHGSATLPTHHFDFPLTLAFADNQTLAQCGVPSSLFKVDIPLRCEGDMYSPPARWCRLNVRMIRQSLEQHIGDNVKEKINEGIDKALKSKTGHRIKNALEGLFH